MSIEVLFIYITIAFFYIISPGPAVFLAINNGAVADMKAVIASSAGNVLGLFVLSSVSILGLGAILISSALLFLVVKIIGAAYLVYLGLKQILKARKLNLVVEQNSNVNALSLKKYFLESFIVAVTNPKPILFFIALFPQFLNINSAIAPQFFVLTGIFMFISFLSLYSYGYIAKSAKRLLNSESIMQWFHRITGGLFIFMGIGLLKLKNTQA